MRHGGRLRFQADDAVLARLAGVLDQSLYDLGRTSRLLEKYSANSAECLLHDRHRCGDQDRSNGSAEHDQGGGALSDIPNLALLQDEPAENTAQGESDTDQAGQV